MLHPRFFPLVAKQVYRAPTRTLLTLAGVGVAMFLFVAVQAMQAGVRDATETTARDTALVVYRQNRFCPAASKLPEHYGDRIAKIPGVASVTPMKIVVTNCRTSLDVVTFRGVPEEQFAERYARGLDVVAGSVEQWRTRTDAWAVLPARGSRGGSGRPYRFLGRRERCGCGSWAMPRWLAPTSATQGSRALRMS